MGQVIPARMYLQFEDRFNKCMEADDRHSCLERLIADMEAYIQKKPDDQKSLYLLALALEEAGKTASAIQLIEKHLSSLPESAWQKTTLDLWALLGNLYLVNLEIGRAFDVLKAMKKAPGAYQWEPAVVGYKALLLTHTLLLDELEKLEMEMQKEGHSLTDILSSYFHPATASRIIDKLEGYKRGRQLLKEIDWLTPAYAAVSMFPGVRRTLLALESDAEDPEYETPVLIAIMDLPELSGEKLLDWMKTKKWEIFDTVKDTLEELTCVEVGGMPAGASI